MLQSAAIIFWLLLQMYLFLPVVLVLIAFAPSTVPKTLVPWSGKVISWTKRNELFKRGRGNDCGNLKAMSESSGIVLYKRSC